MTMKQGLAACLIGACVATSAAADLAVRFDEGAPKDRFSFENTSACAIRNATLVLDLAGSSAGLIFDVTGQGAGVEVFQPLEMVSGQGALSTLPSVRDGDNRVAFDVAELAPGGSIAFTIDVDDTIGQREITVSDSEIQGASVALVQNGIRVEAAFTNRARTRLPLGDC